MGGPLYKSAKGTLSSVSTFNQAERRPCHVHIHSMASKWTNNNAQRSCQPSKSSLDGMHTTLLMARCRREYRPCTLLTERDSISNIDPSTQSNLVMTFLPQACILKALLLSTPRVCCISHAKLVLRWALI